MKYFDFVNHIREVMVCEFADSQVHLRKVTKNNGVELDALSVVGEGADISPTIYLNDYYRFYEDGDSLYDIIREIKGIFKGPKPDINFNADDFSDFNKIKHRIAYKIINRALNETFLKEVPYVEFLDLAIVFYYMLESGKNGDTNIVINNSYMKMWDINIDRLFSEAVKNTPMLLPYTFMPMECMVAEIKSERGVPEEVFEDMSLNLYVLSNKSRTFGATSILYKGVLKKIGEKLGCNFYVLPSSIHEVIIVPESKESFRTNYSEIIKEVNEKELDPVEILGVRAYYYSRYEDILF